MPKLRAWLRCLSARLRHVRIVNGDWRRVCTHGAMYTLSVGKGNPPGHIGLFLDPPYDSAQRAGGLYQGEADDGSVAAQVRDWCLEHGNDPHLRIVLCGYDTEHPALEAAGWRCYEWFKAGFLTGGMANTATTRKGTRHQQHRERLWANPACPILAESPDGPLFHSTAQNRPPNASRLPSSRPRAPARAKTPAAPQKATRTALKRRS
jgi:hypothetical protein